MNQRREAFRRRVYLGGRIVHRYIRSDTACLVRNLSPGGARLVVDLTTPLPDRFDIVIDRCGTTRPAEAIWRSGDELGVRFVTASPEADDLAQLHAALEQSRTELARLRARFAETDPAGCPTGTVLH